MKTGHVYSFVIRCGVVALIFFPALVAQAAPAVGAITVNNLLTNDGTGVGPDYGGTWGDTGGYSKNFTGQHYNGTLDDPDCSALGQYSPIQGGSCPGISFKDDSTCCDVVWSPPNGKSEWNSSITNTTTVVSPYITTFKARHASEMRTQAQLLIATAMYYMPKFSVVVPISGTGPWKLDLGIRRLGIIVNNSANFINVQALTTNVSGGSLTSGSLNLPATSTPGNVNQTNTAVLTGNGPATLTFTTDYEVDSLVTNSSGNTACWRAGQANNGASIGCNPAVNATDGVFLEGTFTYVDHLRYEFNPAVAATCEPLPVTVKACADNASACTTLYTGSPSITPTTTAASGTWTWSANPYTVPASGIGALTLSANTSGVPVTLGATGITAECYNSTNGTVISPCVVTYGSCKFDVMEKAKGAWTVANSTAGHVPVYTKLAGAAFPTSGLEITMVNTTVSPRAVATTYVGSPTIDIVDAATGACAVATSKSSIAAAAFSAGQRTIVPTVAGAVGNAKVRVTDTTLGITSCSDSFTIRPQVLTLASNQSAALKAGSGTFDLTATGVAGYTGTPTLDATKVSAVNAGGTALTYSGALSNGTFGAATAAAGVATASGQTYSEVGYFNLAAGSVASGSLGGGAVSDMGFAGNSLDISDGDCTADYSNTATAGGLYGCYITNTTVFQSPNRFYPDHFNLTATSPCATPGPNGFTYSGQPFTTFAITAQNGASGTTKNYENASGFSKAVTLSVPSPASPGGALNSTSIAASSFAAGVSSNTTTKFTFTSVNTVPTTITLHAVESAGGDGVVSNPDVLRDIWSGRVHMLPNQGSNLLDLALTMRLERYESLTQWQPLSQDACTSLTLNALTSVPAGLAAQTCVLDTGSPGASGQGCATAIVGRRFKTLPGTTGLAGDFNLWLKAPGSGNSGTVTVTPNFSTINWLGSPSGIATFGNAKSNPIIYRREQY